MTRTVAVVGGGIIGLACAWRLAQAGCAVSLFDAAPGAQEASWAAAGMLAPHHEADDPGALWRLGCASLARWPAFARDLGGDDALDHHHHGGLIPILDERDRTEALRRSAALAAVGVPARWLEGDDLARREPHLADRIRSALLLPGGQVNPRLALIRLRERCADLGVALRYGDAVVGFSAQGVATAGGETSCDEVVIASGAWTPALARLAGLDLAGEPVKGQMLRIDAPDGALRGFIHCRHAYLVPRRGLGVVVGSTMVSAGFDRSGDDDAVNRLAEGARRLVPALADRPVCERWTGLRPRLAGGLPLIARVSANLVIATGHFRNGVLLTPITADAVAALVTGAPAPCDLGAFASALGR